MAVRRAYAGSNWVLRCLDSDVVDEPGISIFSGHARSGIGAPFRHGPLVGFQSPLARRRIEIPVRAVRRPQYSEAFAQCPVWILRQTTGRDRTLFQERPPPRFVRIALDGVLAGGSRVSCHYHSEGFPVAGRTVSGRWGSALRLDGCLHCLFHSASDQGSEENSKSRGINANSHEFYEGIPALHSQAGGSDGIAR